VPLKDLLVCVDRGSASDARLRFAFNLARAHRAHLGGAYVVPKAEDVIAHPPAGVVPPGPLRGLVQGGGMTPSGAVTEVLREAEVAEAAAQLFNYELRLHGIKGEWRLFDTGEQSELIELAKTVDLTITGQVSSDTRSPVIRPEDIAIGTGRPVLVVPYAGSFHETVGKRALVAWDGSREAVRALNDALPLLGDAEAVTLIFVGPRETALERQRVSLDRVVRHLQRHDIAAQAEEAVQGEIAISDVLLSRAMDLGADLIVAGLYHHSQLREALIGGVSRDLLDHMTVPVLMSH
jgi:nucleotide-binding universal stress UspA family protein